MKIVNWRGDNFSCAMVEDDDRRMWTTTRGVALALGITERAVLQLYRRHQAKFDQLEGLSGTFCTAKEAGLSATDRGANCAAKCDANRKVWEFLEQNRAYFGIQRMRSDMHIWSEEQVILFVAHCTSDKAGLALIAFIQFIKDQLIKDYAHLADQHKELVSRMIALEEAVPSVRKSASAAGTALAAHRGTVKIRDLN